MAASLHYGAVVKPNPHFLIHSISVAEVTEPNVRPKKAARATDDAEN